MLRRLFLPFVVLLFLAPRPAPAQDTEEPSRNREIRGLVRDQEHAYAELEELEKKMGALAKKLRAAGYTEKADNLDRARKKMYERDLKDTMKEIIGFLQQERLHDAMRQAQDVEAALDTLIAILENRRDEERIRKELEKLRAAREAVEALRKEQEALRARTGKARRTDAASESIRNARAAVEALIREQEAVKNQAQALRDRAADLEKEIGVVTGLITEQEALAAEMKALPQPGVGEAPDEATAGKRREIAGKQEKLAAKTEAETEAAGRASPPAGRSLGQAAARMKQAAREAREGDPGKARADQGKAADALREAKALLEKERALLSEAAPARKERLEKRQMSLADKTRKLSGELDRQAGQEPDAARKAGMKSAAGNLSRAAGDQGRAAGEMERGDPDGARQSQESALARLDQARKDLVDPNAEARRRRLLTDLAGEQRKLEKKAMSLADKLKMLPKMTGRGSVDRAAGSMGDARRSLTDGEGETAEKKQKEAEDYLKQAEEEIDEEKRNYRNWQQEELLFKLAEELTKLIAVQGEINDATRAIDVDRQAAGGALSRKQRKFELPALSEKQTDLAGQTEFMEGKIEKEGSRVFSFVLKSVAEDMRTISRRLARLETGYLVQEMQSDVKRRLEKLESVFREEWKRRNRRTQKQGGRQKPRLIPPIYELLMLRTLQEDLNAALGRFLDRNPDPGTLDDFQREYLEGLAHRQGVVKDIWNRLVEALGIR